MRAGDGVIVAGHWAIIAEDPEREAAIVGPHALYQMNQYIEWGAFGPPASTPRFPDAKAALTQAPVPARGCATRPSSSLVELLKKYPQIKDLHFWAQLPGEPVASGQRRLEYIASKVLPRVRQALQAP